MSSEDQKEKEKGAFEKLQIPYDPDCVSCRVVGSLTLYGAGILVLTNVKKLPESNKAGKIAMGLFGIGLLGAGTMRIFV
ncbi:uncharacterized protein LOC110243879 [Exaiptasia diaphana]|uniref:DUF4536 domain-containing protein n=1 Tax=Exaiptasia diaphana TaxID=2652724 RepID=A0A913XKC9_EXADI|nr:uncharacterized protein LOC110243879 [Exaiptasia diaphana]KXJ25762.1 hypothetical protein AC249_AIPGENE2146 [Exaiptasia diaphana]